MNIERRQDGSNGLFYILNDGKKVAELVYSIRDKKMLIIEHTEVDNSLRGKNIGYELVQEAVTFARDEHYMVLPLCPFAKKLMEKDPGQYEDVLKN